MIGRNTEIDFNKIYISTKGDQYKIIEILPPKEYKSSAVRRVKIKFIKTGFEYSVTLQSAINGGVKDYTEFYSIYGEEYHKLSHTLNKLDRKILKLFYNIVSRCHNPKSNDYYRYGAKGVRVCDEWRKNPKQFIEDFKHLPGYDDWLNAPDDQKYKYHIDKDLLQQNIPIEQRVYSKDTCSIIPMQLNSRLSIKEKYKYIGVANRTKNSWECNIINNNIKYYLGSYTSEIASASVYNYVASQLPNTILNDLGDHQMTLCEALQYFVGNYVINIPSGINFPTSINGKPLKILYDGSKYVGVKKTIINTYQAFYENFFIGEYDDELIAANMVNLYCTTHNKPIVNNLSKEETIDSLEIINSHRIKTFTEKRKDNQLQTTINRLKRFAIGTKLTNKDGSLITVIGLPEINEIHGRFFPVRIRFDDTGLETTISSSTLCKLENGKVSIRDPMKPSVCNVGYVGMPKIPKDKKHQILYKLWHAILTMSYNTNDKGYTGSKVDPRWLNFANFVQDALSLPGYDRFVLDDYDKYTIENITLQPNLSPSERIWSKNTCTLLPKSENRSNMWKQNIYKQDKDLPRGVTKKENNKYLATFTNFKIHKSIRIGTFDDPVMAAAACDWYNLFYNGVYFNNIGTSIPPQVWQQHKSRMRQIYHLINPPKKIYTLTHEDFETRRQRCIQTYGMDIAEE